MHDIVKRYGQKEDDGSISISHEHALKIADEVWAKNPGQWPSKSQESRDDLFATAWGGSDPLGQGKVAADLIPVVMREAVADRHFNLN